LSGSRSAATMGLVWRKDKRGANLADVVEVLEGIGTTLMVISARVDDVIRLLEQDDGEADA
jgi:hypothetical protein